MREYEIVYIFRSNFTPEEIEAKIEKYHGLLTGDGRGEITAVEQWGKRQLAYPIRKQPNGYYVVAQFTADPASLPELERALTLEEDLLRYLIVLSEGELPIPGSMQSEMDDRVGMPPPRAEAPAVPASRPAGDGEAEPPAAAAEEDAPAAEEDAPAAEEDEPAAEEDEPAVEDGEAADSASDTTDEKEE